MDSQLEWAKELSSRGEHGLLFIYYSGHGVSVGNVTNIVDTNGEFYPLPLVLCNNSDEPGSIKGISLENNIMVVAIMDCCRVTAKGITKRPPVSGECYIFYAERTGDSAIADGKGDKPSAFTQKFFDKWEREKCCVFPDIMDGLSPDKQLVGSKHVDLAIKISD